MDTAGARVTPGKGCGKEGCSVNTRIRPGQGWRVWTQPGFSVLKGLGENADLGFGAGSRLKSRQCPARSWEPGAGRLCASCHWSRPVHTLKRQRCPWTVGWAGWCRNPPPACSQGEASHVQGGRQCCRGPCLSPGWPLCGSGAEPGTQGRTPRVGEIVSGPGPFRSGGGVWLGG